jgi:hypothetical protein
VRRALAIAATAVLLLVSGCGSSPASVSDRPSTSAQLQIVSPTANEVAGPDVTIQLSLTGARVVSTTNTGGSVRLPSDQGHVHVSVDGLLVSMAFGLSQQLPHLTAGPHSLQAEFVAIDHKPFSTRVVAAVLFQVRS